MSNLETICLCDLKWLIRPTYGVVNRKSFVGWETYPNMYPPW